MRPRTLQSNLKPCFALLCVALLGCGTQDDSVDAADYLQHDDAPAGHADAGPDAADAPDASCAFPGTFDAIQAKVFDSPVYGCSQASCHGASSPHIKLVAGLSYAQLLNAAAESHDDHGHDEADTSAVIDESLPHGHFVYHGDAGAHGEAPPDDHATHDAAGALPADEHDHAGHDHGTGGAFVVPGKPAESILYDRLRAKVEGTQPTLGGLAMPLGPTAITRAELNAVGAWITAGAPRQGVVPGTEEVSCTPLAAPSAASR